MWMKSGKSITAVQEAHRSGGWSRGEGPEAGPIQGGERYLPGTGPPSATTCQKILIRIHPGGNTH